MDVLRARRSGRATIITRESLENAIAAVAMSGGSTNVVLHLLAVAQRDGHRRSTSTSSTRSASARRCCATCSRAADTPPTDLYEAGGVPLVLKRLQEAGLLHASAITVTGRTIGEHADEAHGDRRARTSCAP